MKYVFTLLLALFFISAVPADVFAQRLAECDACGYCRYRVAPQGWNSCARCLYPTLVDRNTTPTEDKTLVIDTTYNRPPVPARGKYYTQLGCVDLGAGSFSDPSAAGGVLNFVLTRFIFPITGVLAFMSLIYGSFLLVTAQGSPDQISRGKTWVYGAIIGAIFTMASIFIVQAVGADILKIPGFSRAIPINTQTYGDCASPTKCPTFKILTSKNHLPSTYPPDAAWRDSVVDSSLFGPLSTVPQEVVGSASQKGLNVFIEFDNDEDPPGAWDNNVRIQSLIFDGKQCEEINLQRSGSSIVLTRPFGIFWNGIGECTRWSP